MGQTFLRVEVANPADPAQWEETEFLIDSGAIFSVVASPVLERLGIRPLDRQRFTLTNGETIQRRRGGAAFRYEGRVAIAPVIFGEEGDSTLLGITTLESLGFALDPIRRELRPLPLILA